MAAAEPPVGVVAGEHPRRRRRLAGRTQRPRGTSARSLPLASLVGDCLLLLGSFWLRSPVQLVKVPIVAATGAEPPQVRLTHYGWDNRRIGELDAALFEALSRSPFDGISIEADAYSRFLVTDAYNGSAHDASKDVLDRCNRTALRHSFLLVHSATDSRFDWTDDGHWDAALHNFRLLAELAHYGGFRGIVFDMEPYGKSPWDRATQPAADKNITWDALAAAVRLRGADAMRAAQQAYPGLTVWCLYGLSALQYDYEELQWANSVQDVLAASGYGLWAPFFNGWIDALDENTTLIDGNELAYYFTRRREFDAFAKHVRRDLGVFLDGSDGSIDTYERRIRVGHAVYVDGVTNAHRSPRFIGYYFRTDRDRRRLLYSNVYNALRSSDSLVWVYSEIHRWWDAAPNKAIDRRIRSAKANAQQLINEPTVWPGLVAAEKDLREAVTVGGTFTSPDGKAYAPRSWGSALNSDACATWGDRGSYSCTYRYGSAVTLTPRIPGKRVVPPSRTWKNLTVTNWNVHWTVRND